MGRQDEFLSGGITHAVEPGEEDDYQIHTFRHPHGELTVNVFDTGAKVIDGVEVAEGHRRQGIATALFHHAQAQLGEIEHSEWMTRAGRGWMEKVGGRRHGAPSTWYDQEDGKG